MSDINLNFINLSGDQNNSEVVIFQKNQAPTYEEIAVAWRVIKNCGFGSNHPFTYPMEMYVSSGDSWGNYQPQLQAQNGQSFQVTKTKSGDVLSLMNSPAASQNAVDVLNNLEQGAISANIYKAGKLLATKTNVAPGQKATFEFKPTIYIGVASQINEGQVMNSAILSTFNTELSLFGIISADIVMTGGGPGSTSTPFTFTLQNVVNS